MFMDVQCPLTSALKFARHFAMEICHLTFKAASLIVLPDPPSFIIYKISLSAPEIAQYNFGTLQRSSSRSH